MNTKPSTTYALRSILAGIPKGEVGVREEGTNTGKRVREYQAASSEPGTGWYWCAAFLDWCVLQMGKYPDFLKALGKTPEQFEAWRPQTAAAYGFGPWGDDKGLLVIRGVEARTPKAGLLHTLDIVAYRSISHCGIVITDDDKGTITTVEGNTGADGSRNGDGVYLKRRKQSDVREIVRFLP